MPVPPPSRSLESLAAFVREDAGGFVPAADVEPLLVARAPRGLADWARFEASWDDLPADQYMADGGTYRTRRHATLAVSEAGAITLEAHQPHYQSLDYNPLHGGIARHYAPIGDDVVHGATMTAVLRLCADLFGGLAPGVAWHVEAHQFRIQARAGEAGMPTPEGVHRDGVDYVFVMLVRRVNVASGTTTLHDRERRLTGSFTLTAPFDAAILDDTRAYHGVTPVEQIDPACPAFRDVLVVTFRRKSTV